MSAESSPVATPPRQAHIVRRAASPQLSAANPTDPTYSHTNLHLLCTYIVASHDKAEGFKASCHGVEPLNSFVLLSRKGHQSKSHSCRLRFVKY